MSQKFVGDFPIIPGISIFPDVLKKSDLTFFRKLGGGSLVQKPTVAGNERIMSDGATNSPARNAKSLRFRKISLRRIQDSLRGVGVTAARATNVMKVKF